MIAEHISKSFAFIVSKIIYKHASAAKVIIKKENILKIGSIKARYKYPLPLDDHHRRYRILCVVLVV